MQLNPKGTLTRDSWHGSHRRCSGCPDANACRRRTGMGLDRSAMACCIATALTGNPAKARFQRVLARGRRVPRADGRRSCASRPSMGPRTHQRTSPLPRLWVKLALTRQLFLGWVWGFFCLLVLKEAAEFVSRTTFHAPWVRQKREAHAWSDLHFCSFVHFRVG